MMTLNQRVEPTADSAIDLPMEFLVVVSQSRAWLRFL